MSTLQLVRLGKTHPDGTVAVDDIDVSIGDGEFFVIVGPSGCGKTTVLRMIAGLETPTTGDVLIDGEVVTDWTPQRRDIAMAFQQHALYPHMTVAENLGFALRMAGVGRHEVAARVGAVARLLDIDDVLDRAPRRLSGGQQQRVAMGRSIIRTPRLLLMDEPMSNLDTKLRVESRAGLLKLHRRLATTTVFVTHDQVEAMALADRVALMRSGRIVQCGPPIELYERPADMFVARFMGSPPMTIVRATVVRRAEEVMLMIGSHDIALDAATLARRPALGGMDAREIAVGIRPEALHRSADGPLVASVTHAEQLGPDQLVYATIDAVSVVGDDHATGAADRYATIATYVDAHDPVSLWEPFRLRVDTDALHVFDLESGAPIYTAV